MHYGSHSMKGGKSMGGDHYGNPKIGTPKSSNSAPDASKVKEKTSGGKSAKSATMFRT